MELKRYRLSELLTIKNGKDYKHLNEGDIPVFGSGGYMLSVDSYLYDKDSILLPRKGTLSNIQFYDKGKFWTVDTCFYSIINEKLVVPYYLYRYLRSLDLSGYDTGASIPSMTQKTYNSIKVDLPSVAVQQKIASILSAYDSQIENNQKRIKLLEQMAENLYKEWFVRFRFPGYENAEFEGGMPKGWKVVKVKECVDRLRFGTLYGKDSVESDGDVIVIDQSQEPYIGFHNNAPSHIADTQKPIILFGDHSCKFELMIIPFSLAENVVPFVAKSGIDTTFLYFTTHNLIQTTEYKRHWTEFVNKKILLPPANLQREYAKKVIDILSMKQQLIVENRLLSKQRDLLLPRLMSGKLSI